MPGHKRVVLDANILLRAVFGIRVRALLETYESSVAFYTPDICLEEARRYIPVLAERRGIDALPGLELLNQLSRLVTVIEPGLYGEQEEAARARIASRDAADWPVVATALLLRCPIWTEDRDFFGSGIATWTSRNVELFLNASP